MMKLYCLYAVFLSFSLIAQRISIIIPCHPKHAKYLDNLLHIYEQQTLAPDEVIISVSSAHAVRNIIQEISNKPWLFPVKIIHNTNQLRAGENRNKACEHASGDIFICQDADDIPHPQRVEIIHYFFEKYHLDHLLHKWDRKQNWERVKELDQIPFIQPDDFLKDAFRTGDYTQGNPAISSKFFIMHKWSNANWGEDTQYNQEAYGLTKNKILIPIILYHYREELSASKSFDNINLFYPVIIEN